MTCAHCVASVTEEVQELPGVESVAVDLESGRVEVTSAETLDEAQVRAAVEEAGYPLAATRTVSTPLRVAAFVAGLAALFAVAAAAGAAVGPLDAEPEAEHAMDGGHGGHDDASGDQAVAPPRRPDGLPGRLHARPRLHLAPGRASGRLVRDHRPRRRAGHLLRGGAREGPAPHRGAPRPHRLPARAPGARPRRPLVGRRRAGLPLSGACSPTSRPPAGRRSRSAPTSSCPARTSPPRRPRRRARHGSTATRSPSTATSCPAPSPRLTARVTRDGEPVTDLEPYLAAYGHLVALREGDLAYLHVHPDGEPGDGVTPLRARGHLRRRGAERRRLPAVPRLPARRRRAHRGLPGGGVVSTGTATRARSSSPSPA